MRPLGRMVGQGGVVMDFVLGELVVSTNDPTKLGPFLARWGGTIVASVDSAAGPEKTYLVKLDPQNAVVDELLARVEASGAHLTGAFTVSSDAGAKLLALALAEANAAKILVTANFVATFQAIADGTTTEAPSGDQGFTSDAFSLPYFNRGGQQDIGVGAAWQALARAGALNNTVKIMILDGGFAPNNDFPSSRVVVGDWNVPNLLSCSGGSPCPWHGTEVTEAAMAAVDNHFGVAGAGGPVASLLAVPFESDLFALITTLDRIVVATIFGNPKIINMSFSFEIDLGWDIAVKVACLGLCPSPTEALGAITSTVAASNKLLIAAAGNDGKDVDNGHDVIEGSTTIPCELPGVICVGGLQHDSTLVDPQSNFGSKTGDSTVAIYAPFWFWMAVQPDHSDDTAHLEGGTSFSAPFVAGVAALVWAARPSQSAGDVWAAIRDSAHMGGTGTTGNQRRVDALAAMRRVIGGAPPTITLNGADTVELNREFAITSVVRSAEYAVGSCPPTACPVTWSPTPSRVVGNVAYFRFTSAGPRTITATAEDFVAQRATAQKTITVHNSPPVVSITVPAPGATVPQGVTLQLLGVATDLNEGPDPGPGAIGCAWTSSVATDTDFPRTGCDTLVAFVGTGPRTLTLSATDPQGLQSTTSVDITVTSPPVNLPPTITLGALMPSTFNYNTDGYTWDTPLSATASAVDPEGNVPITYTWTAVSFRPSSSTPYSSSVTIQASSTTISNLSWTPSATPSLFGDFIALGNACYQGQSVQVTLTATDSLGNAASRTLPLFKVYRCLLM